DRDPEPSGREGLADLRVIEAIEASARSGRRVSIERVFPERRPRAGQARRRPPHAAAPRSTSSHRPNKEIPDRHPAPVGTVELDGVGADLQLVVRPGLPAAVVADRHVVARHLDALVGPNVLDEAGAVAGDGRVGVDALAGREGVVGAGHPDQLAVDDPAPDLQRRGGEAEPFARKGPGGHDELESGHARGGCTPRAAPRARAGAGRDAAGPGPIYGLDICSIETIRRGSAAHTFTVFQRPRRKSAIETTATAENATAIAT